MSGVHESEIWVSGIYLPPGAACLELLLTLRLLGRERLHLLSAGRGLHGEREPPLGGVDGLYPHLKNDKR